MDVPLYWINLEKDEERRDRMIKFLELFNIKNYRVQGITHSLPYLGCCLSHIDMISKAYFNDEQIAIFTEDDINLQYGVEHIFEAVKKLPEDWEILQCHYIEPSVLVQLIDRSKYKTTNNKILKGYFMSACCYVMNRKGIENFMNKMTNIDKENKNYTIKVNLSNPNCRAEELVYRYINSYTTLIPLFNTIENNTSNIGNDFEYTNRNYTNMTLIDELYKINDKTNVFDDGLIVLPYDLHWISKTRENIDYQVSHLSNNFVSRIYGDIKEYLTFMHSGLGNRLFQYCSVYGMARKDNVIFNVFLSAVNFQHFNNSHKDIMYLEYFKIPSNEFYPQLQILSLFNVLTDSKNTVHTYNAIPINTCKYVAEKGDYLHTDFELKENGTYIFEGYFQNENYFIDYKEDILKMFKEPVYISPILDSFGSNYDNIIAIHVRIGDFVYHKKLLVNLNNYYIEAMYKAVNKINNVCFMLVTSEENTDLLYNMYPCLKGIPFLVNKSRNELIDFYFMARCRGVICSNSTFAWWSAWLNQRQDAFITIPSKWFSDTNQVLSMRKALVVDV